jgi:hypothetical protein
MRCSSNLQIKIRLSFLVLIFYSIVNLNAQDLDFEKIILYANKTPIEVKNSTYKLSAYLVAPYNTEIEKFASIYYWVAKNISYNDELAKNPRLYLEMKEVVDEVMKSKSGVCQHYAELFAELSRLAGLKVYVIDGYTLEKGKVATMSHAWNLIKIAKTWYFIDATWANAVIISKGNRTFPKEYFMISPEENIKTHMPFDPIWQILSSTLKYDEFDSGQNNLSNGNFDYNDSIANYLTISFIEQQKETIRRMYSNGAFNSLVRKEFAIKEKNLKTTIENEEILKYNQGIKIYNNGLGYLNHYIKLRNNRFKDKKFGKNALHALLDSSSANLVKAEMIFTRINISDIKLKYQVKENTMNIAKSKGIISKEHEFVNQFFK